MLKILTLMLLVIFHATATTYKVYYLGGQSNMEGFGENVDLLANYRASLKSVPVFQGNPVADFKPNGGLGH